MKPDKLKREVKRMIASDKDFINKLIDKAIASKCMDIEGAEDNLRLPKNLLCAIYKEMNRQYMPLDGSKEQKKNVENIYIHL